MRKIEFSLRVREGSIELKQFFVNNLTVYRWYAEKRIVREGEETSCLLEFPWKIGEEHSIRLVTVDDHVFEVFVRAPEAEPRFDLEVKNLMISHIPGSRKVDLTYEAEGIGLDSLHLILFTYRSFEKDKRPIYIFYDPRYLAEEGLKRAEAIIRFFRSFNTTVETVDYRGLETLSRDMPKAILVLVNPLRDGSGRKLMDAAPAPLVDPNGNGYIRDDSRYGRSHIYDWMMDQGLIMVTVGSHQPYKRILYEDGFYRLARDAFEAFDAHLFLTSASGSESIIKGAGFLGDYSPIRISGSLGLSYREEAYGFDKDALERYGLSYYAYGEYKLPHRGGLLTLFLPVFIRVGSGGWLAMGDRDFWLSDEQLSHDLHLILLHSVWDSEWVPYGWYWDSGAGFHRGGGLIRASGRLETEEIPLNIVGERLYIRVLGIAYSDDLKRGIIVEKLLEYRLP